MSINPAKIILYFRVLYGRACWHKGFSTQLRLHPLSCFSWVKCWWAAFVLFVIHPLTTQAAFEFQPIGAHTAGAGDVGVALAVGASGMFWNPAAMAWGKRVSVFGAYDRPFGMAELATQALSAGVRAGRHGVGARYTGFGFELYREQVFGLVYGVRVSQSAGLGVGMRALQVTAVGFPGRQWVVFDLGLRVRLNKGVFLGVAARNAGGVRTALLGQGGAVGVGVEVLPTVMVVADVQKEANLAIGAGIGLLFLAHPTLVLRTGAGSRPERLSAGFGVQKGGLSVDYAILWHTVLGVSHRASITFAY